MEVGVTRQFLANTKRGVKDPLSWNLAALWIYLDTYVYVCVLEKRVWIIFPIILGVLSVFSFCSVCLFGCLVWFWHGYSIALHKYSAWKYTWQRSGIISKIPLWFSSSIFQISKIAKASKLWKSRNKTF